MRPALVVSLCLVVLVLWVFYPVLGHDFVSFDDTLYVTDNPLTQRGLTLDGIAHVLTSFAVYNWHPLTMMSHMLDYELFGLNAPGHHLTSLLLHLANTLLLFALLRAMTGETGPSGLVAALFGIHPLHVESVAWIAERKDVLSTLFWLLATIAYVAYVRRGTLLRYVGVMVALTLGLMAKAMLVTLPFTLLLLDVWPLRRLDLGDGLPTLRRLPRLARLVAEKQPLFVIALGISVATVLAQGGAVRGFETVALAVRIENAVVAYAVYIFRMFVPNALAVFYPLREFATGQVALAALLLVAVSAIAFVSARRVPAVLVGWLWYLGTLVPVIGLVQVGAQATADRYTYVPLIGLTIALVWGVRHFLATPERIRLVGGLAVVWVLGLAVMARAQVRVWKDSESLYRHAIEVGVDSALIRVNLADTLSSRDGSRAEALEHYEVAIALDPMDARAHAGLGSAHVAWGEPAAALPPLRRALELRPGDARIHHTIAIALDALGRRDEAMRHLVDAVEIEPGLGRSHHALGEIFDQRGDATKALFHYRKALAADPNSAELLSRVGSLLGETGHLEGAVGHLEAALRRRSDPIDHFNLAIALGALGRPGEVEHLRLALELDPGFEAARVRLAAITAAPAD